MTVKTDLLSLYELQQLDSALDALKRQYAALDRGQAEQPTYEAAKSAHKEADIALHAAQAALRDMELEQKGVEAKRAEEEARLYSGKVRAAKELQALQEEVESLGRRRALLDEKVLLQMEEMEQHRVRSTRTKGELAEITAVLREKVAVFNQESEKMKAQAQELSRQRNAAAKNLQPDLLKRYETLRASKGGLAIVALEDGNTCGGCRMGLPSSVVGRLNEGLTIVLCDNCSRLLFKKA